MKSRFLDLFPVPAFLEMRPMGLAISERAVNAIEFIKKPRGLTLGRFGMRSIPPDAIKEGYVNDKIAVVEAIRSLQKDLSMEFVSASLPEEKAYLFKTELPKSGVADIRQAIEFRLEENVPISAQDAIFDYVVLPGSSDDNHIDVSVSVLPSKVVETYLEIIKSTGLKPVSLSVGAAAVSRAVVTHGNLGAFLVVNVGEVSTSLSIISRGVVKFNLTIPIGGSVLIPVIEKHFSVDTSTAEKIKNERGFVKNKENTELLPPLMSVFSSIKDEINKLIIYWQTHHSSSNVSSKKIEKVILCGRDSNLIGFEEYLSVAVPVPVEVANVWQNAFSYDACVPAISFTDSLDYAAAIGLALPLD